MIDKSDRSVRVSVAALLRVRSGDEAQFVLVNTGSGVAGPLGGAFAYYPAATSTLDQLGWCPEREPDEVGRVDLRGRIPASSLPALTDWLSTGQDRETRDQCLRREITEELDKVGFPELVEHVMDAEFAYTRTVIEEPADVPDKPYMQTRRFDVVDLVADQRNPGRLWKRLVELATDPTVDTVVGVAERDIRDGSRATGIGTQAIYLTKYLHTAPTRITVVPACEARRPR